MEKYFAQVENNIVQRVIVADSLQWCLDNLGGEWIEVAEGKNYPGIGYIYVPMLNNFHAPQPHASWWLNSNLEWEAPVPNPGDGSIWDEENLMWKPL